MRARLGLMAFLLLVPALSGCFGAEERTQWAYDTTQLDALAAQGRTGRNVVVAVLDTGIDPGHPSLDHLRDGDTDNGELIAYRDFIGGAQGVQNANDPDGHGTHVIGIMSARKADVGNRLLSGGVALKGASPDIQLMVARVCTSSGCNGQAIVDALRWATRERADVISLSLGGNPGLANIVGSALGDAMENAINDAVAQGIVVVASAGNDGAAPGDVAAPARFKPVIAVGAVDSELKLWSEGADTGSQHGSASQNDCRRILFEQVGRCAPNQKPEIVAPGVEILSTWKDDTYATATGTSQATPFVTSAVALILQGKPDLRSAGDVERLKAALVDAARDLPDQERPHDDRYGYGILQALSAQQRYG